MERAHTILCRRCEFKEKMTAHISLYKSPEVDKEGFKLQTCPCECPKAVTEISKDLPDAKISSEIIRKKLEVEATNLTATVRKKTSAADERGSSTTFGVIALTMLGLEGFFISLGDIIMVFFYTKQKFVEMFCPTA